MSYSLNHPRNILVSTLKRLYDYGMTTTSGGNLSIKDADGNIWITPSGIDKGTLRPEDVIKVLPDGTCIGPHRPSCELPFHRSVYALRPDVKAVLHAHAPALVAFSLVGRTPNVNLVPGVAEICGKVSFSKYEIPGSEKLGKIIAADFQKGYDCVMMENHGAVVCGTSIAQCFARYEALDYMARIELDAVDIGKVHSVSGNFAPVKWDTFQPEYASPDECALRESMEKFAARCYRQQLFFSGNSFIATRIKDDDILVTPKGYDPLNVNYTEFVRIANGKAEAGKNPASAAQFCRDIFAHCPWANAIFLSRPPNLMAFAASGTVLNSRTIPESYINLRDMPVIPAEQLMKDPKSVIAKLCPSNPVLVLENCGILTVGKHLTEAFDRLEVGEFTAKCIVLASRVGKMTPINQAQVDEIIDVFGLPRA